VALARGAARAPGCAEEALAALRAIDALAGAIELCVLVALGANVEGIVTARGRSWAADASVAIAAARGAKGGAPGEGHHAAATALETAIVPKQHVEVAVAVHIRCRDRARPRAAAGQLDAQLFWDG
jgi:hypothetical protein